VSVHKAAVFLPRKETDCISMVVLTRFVLSKG
jgi:hypothetical protein